MLYDKINNLITSAAKMHNTTKLAVLRLIKSELVNFIKNGKELTEKDEMKIIQKMITQRQDSIKEYNKAQRYDLSSKENAEIQILNDFLPVKVSDEEIISYTNEVIAKIELSHNLSIKDMKTVMDEVKCRYPLVNGKLVADIVKQRINK